MHMVWLEYNFHVKIQSIIWIQNLVKWTIENSNYKGLCHCIHCLLLVIQVGLDLNWELKYDLRDVLRFVQASFKNQNSFIHYHQDKTFDQGPFKCYGFHIAKISHFFTNAYDVKGLKSWELCKKGGIYQRQGVWDC